MKIQCPCGAKFSFEVTPEQAQRPMQFVCPTCGLDSSAAVTALVRQQSGLAPPVEIAPAPARAVAAPASSAPPPSAPSAAAPSVRLNRPVAAPPAESTPSEAVETCARHNGVPTVDHCRVCHKPICPQCMDLFGFVCSPLCKQKAELKGIAVPVFAGQKSVREARRWRVLGWAAGTAVALVVGLLGFMMWYRLFGSHPKPVFAVRFEQPAYSGASFLCGPGNSQVVFLHGGKLARHDTKTKQEVWSVTLVDANEIMRRAKAQRARMAVEKNNREAENPDAESGPIPDDEELIKRMARWEAEALELRVVGQNVWVASPKKVVRYDWDSGESVQELPVQGGFGGLIERGDELLRLEQQADKDVITHINLASGQIRTEEIAQPKLASLATNQPATILAGAKTGARPPGGISRALDARKVEKQFSEMSLPAQLAAPAILSGNRTQERTLAELNGGRPEPESEDDLVDTGGSFVLIPAKDGYVQFSTKLIEKKLVAQQAMKAAPAKSALDGPVSVTASREVANEIFNQMQRDRGGDTVLIDESRYLVTLHRGAGKDAEWQGEVVGRPAVFPLASVTVIAGRQKIIVLDKQNKQRWESALTYDVEAAVQEGDPATTAQGPCVERGNTLFVFDQGVLTAFDIQTGNAQWRLPSVGISGLFFDDEGMLYVSSTTASPDTIKYSRQIDVAANVMGVILKLDPRTGKTLWTHQTGGSLAYVSGKYLYTFQGFGSNDDDDKEEFAFAPPGTEVRNMARIRRINPRNGRDLWTHEQLRLPLHVRFDQNRIYLVFKKEVQVLECGTF